TPEDVKAFVVGFLLVGRIFVAEDRGGSLAGMIAVIVGGHLGLRYADEQAWWVGPEYRSGTLGPRLLRHVEAWARSEGLPVLAMVAPAGSTIGGFYERLGYHEVETKYVKTLT